MVVTVVVVTVVVIRARGQRREGDAGEGWGRVCSLAVAFPMPLRQGRIMPGEHTPPPPPSSEDDSSGSRAPVCSSETRKTTPERPERFNRPPSRKGGRRHPSRSGQQGARAGEGEPEGPETPRPRGEHSEERRRRVSTDFALWRETQSRLLSRAGRKDISQGSGIQRRAPWLQRPDGGTEKVLAQPGRSRMIRDQRAPCWGRGSPNAEAVASPASAASCPRRGTLPSPRKARVDRAPKDSKSSHLSL